MSAEAVVLLLATTLRDLGFLLYGGPLVAFTVLIAARGAISATRSWDLVRVYRAWGPGLGLSLGACILGLLVHHYLTVGAFVWPTETTADKVSLAAWLSFGTMWASNLKLEIWTLEPLRKLDQKGQITDEAAYEAAVAPLVRHMVVHSALILLASVLWEISLALR